jgi:drug/metabolite transporter (DMT)-like permease
MTLNQESAGATLLPILIEALVNKRNWSVPLAFAAIYLVWGSTYLGIRFAIETFPPFVMASIRFLLAGAILYSVMRLRGAPMPTRTQWRSAAIIGALLLFGGNGGVTVAEQFVPSGLAALLVAMVPFWMVLMDWLRPAGIRPRRGVFVGLGLGFVGLALLIGPSALLNKGSVNLIGVAILIVGTLAWATGSISARYLPLPSSSLLMTGMEMLTASVLFILAGFVTQEWTHFDPSAVSLHSVLALGYLVCAAFVGFGAYTFLLQVTTPARVSTYAFVNPVVAVFLGWLLAGEPLAWNTIIAALVIVSGVAMITASQMRMLARAVKPQADAAKALPIAES